MKSSYALILKRSNPVFSSVFLILIVACSLNISAVGISYNPSVFAGVEHLNAYNLPYDSTVFDKLTEECTKLAPGEIWLQDFAFAQVKPKEQQSHCVVLAAGSRYTVVSATNPATRNAAFIVQLGREDAIQTVLSKIEITSSNRSILTYDITKTDVYYVAVNNEGTIPFDMAAMIYFKEKFDTSQIQQDKADSMKIVNYLRARSIGCGSEVYFIVEEMPKFINGGNDEVRKYIQNHVVFPKDIKAMGITGKVFVSFVVNTKGGISYVKVVRGLDPSLDEEVVKVVSNMPLWTPGKQHGRPANVSLTLPVVFE
ncbi:MAG TPA: energy transducer TonB [Williamwhitmania sp.]|nr:energy transducer TonB [Williamwhitmania sp.]